MGGGVWAQVVDFRCWCCRLDLYVHQTPTKLAKRTIRRLLCALFRLLTGEPAATEHVNHILLWAVQKQGLGLQPLRATSALPDEELRCTLPGRSTPLAQRHTVRWVG